MTKAGSDDLAWDENGRLITGLNGLEFFYNWDGKLSDVDDANGNPLISLKYDPMGNRIYKSGVRYIVDISGDLPTILMELGGYPANYIMNRYYYADAEVLVRRYYGNLYYYIHDRLGSVRLVVEGTTSSARKSLMSMGVKNFLPAGG